MADVSCRRFLIKQFFWNPGRTILFIICICVLLVLFVQNKTDCHGDRPLQQCDERKSTFGQRKRDLEDNKNNLGENQIERLKCFLMIIILAAPTAKSEQRRNTIRKTWLLDIDELDRKVVVKFVIGTSQLSAQGEQRLRSENKIHGDLLLLPNLKDSYQNLTTKVLQSFVWISANIDSIYVLKADDDTFVRVDEVVSELETVSPKTNLYWGFFRGDANVKKRGPWAERKWILCDKYLPYANGGGYALSASLVNFIARNADILQIYNSEDVSVGTWLAAVKVTRLHDPRFDTEYKTRGCRNVHIVSHKQSIEDMQEKHEQIKTKGQLCVEETRLRNSFIYDWTVPPSQCCKRVPGIP